jgi:hypothetical protein
VEGAGPDDDQEAVIALFDNFYSLFATFEDSGEGVLGRRDLVGEELRLYERILAQDCIVLSVFAV